MRPSLLLAAACLAGWAVALPAHLSLHGTPPPPFKGQPTDLPPIQTLQQRVDHFNPLNNATFAMRYVVNDTFFKPGGVDASTPPSVLLLINGESPMEPIWAVEGYSVMLAQQYGALLVSPEHRGYGASQPGASLDADALRYVTSRQALEDLAQFHAHIAAAYNLPDSTRWVAIGGSYSGALAAWFSLKYPHLAVGAWSNSGPVQARLDFVQYMEVVTASLQTSPHGKQCTQRLQEGTTALQALMANATGRAAAAKLFNACTAPVTDKDVSNFVSTTGGAFMGVVQYNKDNRAFEGATNTNVTIDVVCDTLVDSTADALSAYAAVVKMLNGAECFDPTYSGVLKQLGNTDPSSPAAAGRVWTWQTCAEFAYFQSTDGGDQVFGDLIPLSFYTGMCADLFGVSAAAAAANVNATNVHYGGAAGGRQQPNVVWVNGRIDPWHALSVLESDSPKSAVVVMNTTAHCAAMYPPTASDPAELTNARATVGKVVGQWLAGQPLA